MGQTISVSQAELFLDHDYQDAEEQVLSLVKVPLTENQLGALTSFVFNLGAGNLSRSTLLRKLNQGDYTSAAEEFNKWVFAGGKKLNGLVKRRAEERELFITE